MTIRVNMTPKKKPRHIRHEPIALRESSAGQWHLLAVRTCQASNEVWRHRGRLSQKHLATWNTITSGLNRSRDKTTIGSNLTLKNWNVNVSASHANLASWRTHRRSKSPQNTRSIPGRAPTKSSNGCIRKYKKVVWTLKFALDDRWNKPTEIDNKFTHHSKQGKWSQFNDTGS